jgi:hypothetical protein
MSEQTFVDKVITDKWPTTSVFGVVVLKAVLNNAAAVSGYDFAIMDEVEENLTGDGHDAKAVNVTLWELHSDEAIAICEEVMVNDDPNNLVQQITIDDDLVAAAQADDEHEDAADRLKQHAESVEDGPEEELSEVEDAIALGVADTVNDVLMYLSNRKAEAVELLFGEAAESYKAEWHARDPFKFWCALDLSNRKKVVQAAAAAYAEFK